MMPDAIALAADHAGYELKNALKDVLTEHGYATLDLGTDGPESVDYPDYGAKLADAIADGAATRGVLVCGTGIGISIAANRHKAVRCALCHDVTTAKLAREHNNANVLALGARVTGTQTARDVLYAFLTTDFAGDRHQKRVAKLGA